MQWRHPVSGAPAFQVTLPSTEGCVAMLAMFQRTHASNPAMSFWSCTGTSVSPSLKARSILRNKTYAYLLDVEAITNEECVAFVEAAMANEGKENIEVVSPCKDK
jgi:hypothetical protein